MNKEEFRKEVYLGDIVTIVGINGEEDCVVMSKTDYAVNLFTVAQRNHVDGIYRPKGSYYRSYEEIIKKVSSDYTLYDQYQFIKSFARDDEPVVSFETSKLLRSKYFDQPCRWVWNYINDEKVSRNNKLWRQLAESFMEGEPFITNSDIEKVYAYEGWNSKIRETYLCPTQSSAMKWLRDEFRIIPDIHYNALSKKYVADVFTNSGWQYIKNGEADTYEDACEIAIKAGVNLINF